MATPVVHPDARQIIREQIKLYPQEFQNVRKYMPKTSVPPDTLKVMTITYDTTITDINSPTGVPVEIPITYSDDTVTVVDYAARTPEVDIRHFANANYVKKQTRLVLKQFLVAENTLVKNVLDAAPVNTIQVDVSADTVAPTIKEVVRAIRTACFEIETYTNAKKLMLISPDIKDYLYETTPELKTPMDIIDMYNIEVVQLPEMAGSQTAYILPLDEDSCEMVQVKPLDIRIEKLHYDMASVYGKESVAFIVNQPHVIQKLDFTTQ